jgi:hypothetical protein
MRPNLQARWLNAERAECRGLNVANTDSYLFRGVSFVGVPHPSTLQKIEA